MYETGQFYRRRYKTLLGDQKYSFKKVYIVSTDMDRTIMSAQMCLAGLFPPTDGEIWNDQVLWLPIPLRTLPEDQDLFFRGTKLCPKQDYYALYNYYMRESPEALEIFAKYGDQFPYWSEMSGKNITSLDDISFIYKKLLDHKEQNR